MTGTPLQGWLTQGGVGRRRGLANRAIIGVVATVIWGIPATVDLNVDPENPVFNTGSLAVGDANYEIPATNVRYVDVTGGVNSGPGNTLSAPWQTLAYALANCVSGDTLILREGIYEESITITRSINNVTIQAYPFEEVWLDGSKVYTGWTSLGNGVYEHSYTIDFARFTPYAGDDPLRNYMDAVLVDGTYLTQIADNSTPAAGQFSVSQSSNWIRIRLVDSSNPSSHEIRVHEKRTALVLGTGCGTMLLRGFGVRRYSPDTMESLPSPIYIAGSAVGTVVENVVIRESEHGGITTIKDNCTLRQITVEDFGFTGIMVSSADYTTVDRVLVQRGNRHRWASEPATGGIKATRSRYLNVVNSTFKDVWQCALIWLDISCPVARIINNDCDNTNALYRTRSRGIFLELSDGGKLPTQQYSVVAGNRVSYVESGYMAFDSGYAFWWNNTADNCRYSYYFWQDERYLTTVSQTPGATISELEWHTQHLSICNNVVTNPNALGMGGSPIQMLIYDEADLAQRSAHYGTASTTPPPFPYEYGLDWVDRMGSNHFALMPNGGVMVQLGDGVAASRDNFNTPSALAAAGSAVGGPWPGGVYTANYQGGTVSDSNAVAMPDIVADALDLPVGTKKIGPPLSVPLPRSN